MYAIILDGVVSSVHDEMPILSANECCRCIPCSEEAQAGWKLVDGVVVEPTLDDKLAEITARYDAKRSALQGSIVYALAADGENMDATLNNLRSKWSELADSEAMEVMELLMA